MDLDKVRSSLEALLVPPEEGQTRKLEHYLALAAAGYVSYRALAALLWAASHPTEFKNSAIESAIEAAKCIPAVKAMIQAEEDKSLVGIKRSLHGDGDPSERSQAASPTPARTCPPALEATPLLGSSLRWPRNGWGAAQHGGDCALAARRRSSCGPAWRASLRLPCRLAFGRALARLGSGLEPAPAP